MSIRAEREALLKAAIAKIPKLASIIAAMPLSEQAEALRITERSYWQIAAKAGLGEKGEQWVSAIMDRLQADTESMSVGTQLLLRALYREVVRLGVR